MSKNRLVIIHPIDDFYGATKILSFTIQALYNRYNLIVWTQKDNGGLRSFLKEINCNEINIVEVPCIPVLHKKIFSLIGIFRLIFNSMLFLKYVVSNSARKDIFFINTFTAFFCVFFTGILKRKTYVHCHEYQADSLLGRLLAKAHLIFSDKIICVSEKVRRYVSTTSDKVLCIWNGIPSIEEDMNECSYHSKYIKHKNDKINVILIGRVTKEKGYWYLADAVAKLSMKSKGQLMIHCFGDAPPNRMYLYNEFEEYIKSKHIDNCFNLHGFVFNASEQIKYCEIVIVPSMMTDPFPTTVLESMRAGKSTVITSHIGSNEIISDGITGFVCDKDNPISLTSILESIINGSVDYNKVGIEAYRFYKNNLTLDKYQNKIALIID